MDSPLYAPWRMDYIRSLEKPAESGCFLCKAGCAADEPQQRAGLCLWLTPLSVVLMNRYPYTNGHLLICPRRHIAELEELTEAEALDLQTQTAAAVRLLKTAVAAQGFNIGINLGRCAGAGVPGHLHQHVVPRWAGDVNFLAVVGQTRLVPQALEQLYTELLACIKQQIK